MKREYYDAYGGDPQQKPRRALIVHLLDIVVTLLTAAVGVALIVTYLVPYINPGRIWFLPVLGLAAPAVYVAAVILMLYWVIRWRWIQAGIMLLLVVVGFGSVTLFWRPEIRRSYEAQISDRGTVKVMTYNVRGFYGPEGESSVGQIVELIREQNPDIVCLQEFNGRLAGASDAFRVLCEDYETARFGAEQDPEPLDDAGLAILSKFRILRSGTVLTPHSSVWADLLIDEDTLRVFNNHLHSTAINADDNEYITTRRFLSDTAREVKFRSIVSRLRENSALRAAQVDSISTEIRATRWGRLVCGDFNDTPVSYVYRRMSAKLNDAFSECGSGYSHTYRGFFNTLRIDYVLYSEPWQAVTYEVLPVEYSDHHPVVVRLRRES